MGANLRVKRVNLVVDRRDDGAAHGNELVVHVGDEGVRHRAVGHEAVALEQLGVVLGYLALDDGAADTAVGGQELVFAALAADEVADVAGHVELVVEVENLGVGLVGLLHVHVGGGLYVGDEVLALVGGDVGVDIAELALDDAEALVDELAGAHGYLVLVLHPVFVVDGDKGVEELLGALDGIVAEGEADDGGVLVVKIGTQTAGIAGNGGHKCCPANLDAEGLAFLICRGGLDGNPAELGGDGVAHLTGDLVTAELLAIVSEVVEGGLAAFIHIEGETGIVVVADADDAGLNGEVAAVEHLVVESAVECVVHVEVEALDGLEDDGGRLDGGELVVDIGVVVEEAHVGERVNLGGERLFVVFLDQDGGRAGVDGVLAEDVEHGVEGEQVFEAHGLDAFLLLRFLNCHLCIDFIDIYACWAPLGRGRGLCPGRSPYGVA